MIRTYSELISLPTFEERLEYLKVPGIVGDETFGLDRYLNQEFYKSKEWRQVRNTVITRDCGCDLGILDKDEYGNYIYEIPDKILIHHLKPLTREDIINKTKYLLDPEYLVCVSNRTHRIIHYGNTDVLNIYQDPIIRTKNDTCPWRH